LYDRQQNGFSNRYPKGVRQIMRDADSDGRDGLPEVTDFSAHAPASPRVWGVGALCRAVADALDARFNPVAVRGEITGFSRAASGHCYFSLKDASGQIRCAMFRRAASLLNFVPRDGELVEVRGKLGVYEQRGDLQLIVESLQKAGQGALFEQFLRLKAQLEAEGLFEAARKRAIPIAPRGIGVVTSLGAAALHDVASAVQRRVPHIPVTLAPASVQGAQAPAELCEALSKLYLLAQQTHGLSGDLVQDKADTASVQAQHVEGLAKASASSSQTQSVAIDVILLVRGGGSLEDLWAFNDERLARLIAQSPVPIISGVGHETDFTIADFVADLRAPTPTAAAELCATERSAWLGAVQLMGQRLQSAVHDELDIAAQQLDIAANRLGRPSDMASQERLQLQRLEFALQRQTLSKTQLLTQYLRGLERDLTQKTHVRTQREQDRCTRAERSLELLNPQHVLERGYAVLRSEAGQVVASRAAVKAGQRLTATVADGQLPLTVASD
jgi:exodeoxyribonuclease VII large subunit